MHAMGSIVILLPLTRLTSPQCGLKLGVAGIFLPSLCFLLYYHTIYISFTLFFKIFIIKNAGLLSLVGPLNRDLRKIWLMLLLASFKKAALLLIIIWSVDSNTFWYYFPII